MADLVINPEEDDADPMVLANPKLIAEQGMVSVTVISKIGQKVGFIYVFGSSFIVPYFFVTIWKRAN